MSSKNEDKKQDVFSSTAILTKAETLADRTVQLKFELPELRAEDYARIFSMIQTESWFFLSAKKLSADQIEVPTGETDAKQQKTPGQRLRASLHVLWENTKTTLSFEQFYSDKMERFIEVVKAKLPPRE